MLAVQCSRARFYRPPPSIIMCHKHPTLLCEPSSSIIIIIFIYDLLGAQQVLLFGFPAHTISRSIEFQTLLRHTQSARDHTHTHTHVWWWLYINMMICEEHVNFTISELCSIYIYSTAVQEYIYKVLVIYDYDKLSTHFGLRVTHSENATIPSKPPSSRE